MSRTCEVCKGKMKEHLLHLHELDEGDEFLVGGKYDGKILSIFDSGVLVDYVWRNAKRISGYTEVQASVV